jgi:hypothetical protein
MRFFMWLVGEWETVVRSWSSVDVETTATPADGPMIPPFG